MLLSDGFFPLKVLELHSNATSYANEKEIGLEAFSSVLSEIDNCRQSQRSSTFVQTILEAAIMRNGFV